MSNMGGDMDQHFDLEERTRRFAASVIAYLKGIPESTVNKDMIRQLSRSATSVGANYLEANDSLGLRDFTMKIKTARREAKEARYWLGLLECPSHLELEKARLSDEANQLVKILSAIAKKMEERLK